MKVSDITVDCLAAYGTDLDVVNAARVSFNKESEWTNTPGEMDWVLRDKDKKLIKYLAEHNHWSPFSHCFLSFRIKAPLFCARQLGKHQVGLSWNEVSRRYVDDEPEFYFPKTWRKRADNVKQGSSNDVVENKLLWLGGAESYTETGSTQYCLNYYKWLLMNGVCPEQARMALPQNMMTEWIWSGSLYAFARVCNLRLDPHTQLETRIVAAAIYDYMMDNFPESTKHLVKVVHNDECDVQGN